MTILKQAAFSIAGIQGQESGRAPAVKLEAEGDWGKRRWRLTRRSVARYCELSSREVLHHG
jgi:hypothetical protein